MYSPSEIACKCADSGQRKAETPGVRLFLLAIMAGIFIAVASVGAAAAAATVENPSLARLISGLVFPGGLVMVILAGSELFTGDCLMLLAVLERRAKALEALRALIIVYLGNFFGAILVSLLVVYGHTLSMFEGRLVNSMVETAAAKCQIAFSDAFMRGIMCNIVVCVAVWMSNAATDAGGKVTAIFLPLMIFVISGYEHSVANMAYISAGLMAAREYAINAEGLNLYGFIVRNELPVSLGNLLGGAFVGAMYWFIYFKRPR